ncbi:TIGR04283 family arsenosugar biosynthesis glycosyltransferase [Thiolapillus sp.]
MRPEQLASISIIIPTLNEAKHIEATLETLQPMRKRGHEILLADGGSSDDTTLIAAPMVSKLLECKAGRAAQMNTGARQAHGEILWFIHADTLAQPDMDEELIEALSTSKSSWGRFDVSLSGSSYSLRIIERMMNWRSRLTGIATGDQGIFVRRNMFEQIGGFPSIPLMEDIEISTRLKKTAGKPLCLHSKLLTSSRRWESRGVLHTVLLMWRLRLAYALGASPADLAKRYQ